MNLAKRTSITMTPRRTSLCILYICLPLFLLMPYLSTAQTFRRTITKKNSFTDRSNPDNKLIIKNINGSVTVEAYDGDTIELTVNEEIRGSREEIEQAKRELDYKLERDGNLVFAYPDAPFITVTRDGDDINFCMNRDDDDDDEHDYRFTHEVTVRVPRNIILDGSTINKGKLIIDGNFKKVEAGNVNGALELRHMISETHASTVNGDISINYDRAPDGDSEYHTINGTIDVHMPETLSADIYFQSMHGDLYTDFNNIKRLTPEVQKKSRSGTSGITYQVDRTTPIRIGRGGPKLRFKVLNGDVYIRKQS